MFLCTYSYLVFLTILNVGNATRRIVAGSTVKTHKRYMVYLIKAENDAQLYDAWLCGGAIVTPYFIITSAACVLDVEHMYAIAGYEKYVTNDKIHSDECIKGTKRKVIYTCVPKYYELDYIKIDKWANIDIALAKIDKPYKKDDIAFKHCSYEPNLIHINFETKYQKPGTDAMVLGWGHPKNWRQPGDNHNYNMEHLHYASTLIESKDVCKKHYEKYNMSQVINKYMICTYERGNLNEKGELITHSVGNATDCGDGKRSIGAESADLIEPMSADLDHSTLRYSNKSYSTVNPDGTITYYNYFSDSRRANTHKPGICQNDHGGPLVTWVGSHEVLIGVASVFKVDKEFKCTGPYLFTSTQCNGAFLSCVLDEFEKKPEHKRRYRRELCDTPQLRGYDKYERYISWDDFPDNAADLQSNNDNADMESNNDNSDMKSNNDNADMDSNNDNEKILTRPQRPLYERHN